MTKEIGRGFSEDNLERMRKFYVTWGDRVLEFPRRLRGDSALEICQQPAVKLSASEISAKPSRKIAGPENSQKPSGKSATSKILQQPAEELAISAQLVRKLPFPLSWTHYVVLLTIKDPDERSFYEIEATNAGWSVPELKRQKASCLFERLALSRNKAGVKGLAEKGQIISRPEDVLKDPLVLVA